MQSKLFLGGFAVFSALMMGCGASPDASLDPTEGESADESRASTWERFVGSWEGSSGPFHAVVFTRTPDGRGHHYFGDVDTGIRCVRAPCPSSARVEGNFTANASAGTLTLNPATAHPGTVLAYDGVFQFRLVGSSTLVLSRSGREVARLTRVVSYCTEADDCAEQNLITPRCLGYATCGDNNRCGYRCGQPPRPTCATLTCAPGTFCTTNDAGDAYCLTRCATVRCTATTHCVADAAGTRCEPNATGPRCGTTTCAAGMVCCNPLRNICTAPGMFCIQ